MTPRRCYQPPPAAAFLAAEHLVQAVDSHNGGDFARSAGLIRAADAVELGEWFMVVATSYNPAVHGHRPVTPLAVQAEGRSTQEPRMPNAAAKREIIERDGYHCRFCDMPVIPLPIIKAMFAAYPEHARYGKSNAARHRYFLTASLQFDHIVPYSRGGTSTTANVVVTCAVCNYGRQSATLEEAALLDPREFPIKQSSWNGLAQFQGK